MLLHFLSQKTSNSSPWEQTPLWVNSSFTWNSKVGPKGHSFAPQQRDFSKNNPSQGFWHHGLLFSAQSFIYKQQKSGERIGLWQTCPQKKIWGQVFRCHKSAAVKEQHWFTSAKCQPVNPHWHTVEKQAFPSTWAISFTKPPFLSAPSLHSNVYRRAALCFEVLMLLLFIMPDSFSGLFFPPLLPLQWKAQ